jgi:hypothetical protein
MPDSWSLNADPPQGRPPPSLPSSWTARRCSWLQSSPPPPLDALWRRVNFPLLGPLEAVAGTHEPLRIEPPHLLAFAVQNATNSVRAGRFCPYRRSILYRQTRRELDSLHEGDDRREGGLGGTGGGWREDGSGGGRRGWLRRIRGCDGEEEGAGELLHACLCSMRVECGLKERKSRVFSANSTFRHIFRIGGSAELSKKSNLIRLEAKK